MKECGWEATQLSSPLSRLTPGSVSYGVSERDLAPVTYTYTSLHFSDNSSSSTGFSYDHFPNKLTALETLPPGWLWGKANKDNE